jgi:pSer/pThr/pTyr-binding forkhead associated (FHA) protein
VSRCHAYIDFNGHAFVVSDAGSTNGVYLNGQRLVSEAVLKDSDKLDIGGVSITVYI